jgi:hypothetical protein
MENEFIRAYRGLECKMKDLAESDGDVYLPNPEPSTPSDYIFICMEPSLGGWARSAHEALEKVASGFKNFLAGIEPMILHFSARRYLCEEGEQYHITDFSKGAMLVKRAGKKRTERCKRWYALLQKEIELIAKPGARIFAVGNAVAEQLRRQDFPWSITPLIHYSPLASGARKTRLRGHEGQFQSFANSFSYDDFIEVTEQVLKRSAVPNAIAENARSIVSLRGRFSESQLKLVYCYKLEFEATKRKTR